MDFANILNSVTEFTNIFSAVNGVANTVAPMLQSVDNTLSPQQGYQGDYYQPYPQPPAYATYQVWPPVPLSTSQPGIVGTIGKIVGGGLAGKLTQNEISEGFKNIKNGGLKSVGMGMLKAGGIGAAVSGVVSGIQNMVRVSKGTETGAGAAGNITADTVGGLLAGTTGGLTAGAAGLLLSKMGAQVGGLPFAIGVVAAGALGAVAADALYQGSGVRDNLSRRVRSAFNGGYA